MTRSTATKNKITQYGFVLKRVALAEILLNIISFRLCCCAWSLYGMGELCGIKEDTHYIAVGGINLFVCSHFECIYFCLIEIDK
jgi:hypothetical protein